MNKEEQEEVIVWDKIKEDVAEIMILLNKHIEEAIPHGNKHAQLDFLKLDVRMLCRKLFITENKFREDIAKLQSEELKDKLAYIEEQMTLAFLEDKNNRIGNKSLMKDYAEHKINLYSKDGSEMPVIIILKPTLEHHTMMVKTLLDLTKYRYDFDRQQQVIEKNLKKVV